VKEVTPENELLFERLMVGATGFDVQVQTWVTLYDQHMGNTSVGLEGFWLGLLAASFVGAIGV
jgi:hypothetical protein